MENFRHFIRILYLERSPKMLEINVHITAPELVEAVHDLAKMLAGKPASKFEQSPPQVQDKGPELLSGPHMAPTQHPAPTQVTPPANTPRPVPAPPMPTSMPAQPPTPPVAPAAPVPTTAPQYDYPTLFNAAAALMGQGKGAQLQQLLTKYGIQRLPDLPADQYGAYATDLRGLGAKI